MSGIPTLRDWIFSLKTFFAAMVALWLALAIGLPNPYWSMAAVYIVAQPIDAATRAKGVYRFLGTVLGAAAAVALVPAFDDRPLLLATLLALWTGLCLFISLQDRTPRAYVFMLAGYSASIVGYPSVLDPTTVFATALARTEEITLGVACITVVSGVVLPRALGPLLAQRSDAWLAGVAEWARAVLTGDPDSPRIGPLRKRLAAEAVDLQVLSTQLAYDTSRYALSERAFSALRRRALLLLPVLSGLADRVRVLTEAGAITPKLRTTMVEAARFLDAPDVPGAEALRAHIAAARPDLARDASWERLLASSLLTRLDEVANIVEDVTRLRAALSTGRRGLPAGLRVAEDEVVGRAWHLDPGMAFLSALCAVVSILLLSAFWIATAWPEGAGAVTMVAVGCSFFAGLDDPVPPLRRFLFWAMVAIGIDVVLLFAVLPRADGFPMLVLALGAVFIPSGLLINRPPQAIIGLAIAAVGGTLLAIQNAFTADFATFLAGGLSFAVGLGVAVAVTATIRTVGTAWSARRLLRASWSEIAALGRERTGRTEFTARMLDRLGLLAPRQAALADMPVDGLADIRVGLGLLLLRDELPAVSGGPQDALRVVFRGVTAHYAALARAGRPAAAPDALREDIDSATRAVVAARLPHEARLVQVLVGLRRALFPDAPGPTARAPALLQAAD